MDKIWEHLRAVLKHWVFLMGGIVAVGITLFERFRGLGVPNWIYLTLAFIFFFVAFHLAWLDKDKELRHKSEELQKSLGAAPEVVLEYECAVRNPLTLRNLGGSTAYHIQIQKVVIGERCTATFDEVSHLEEGTSVRVLPLVQDRYVTDTDEWKKMKDDFAYVLEAAYETWGRGSDPVHLQLQVDYADKNGRKYQTLCNIEFDRFKKIAKTACEPPRVYQGPGQ
jgi:hypothetical protein